MSQEVHNKRRRRGTNRRTADRAAMERQDRTRQAAREASAVQTEQTARMRRPAPREEHAAREESTVQAERSDRRQTERRREDRRPLPWYSALALRLRRVPGRWRSIGREKRAHHFPESDRLPIQLVLFGWNMLPMLGSLLQERIWTGRKRAFRRLADRWAWLERHRVHPAVFMGVGLVLVAAALFWATYTVGTTVRYDGEVVGTVASEALAQRARGDLERITTRTLGETYTIDDGLFTYSTGLLSRSEMVDGDTFEETLSDRIGLVTPAYCLYVDGERIGATPYQGALEELLRQLRSASTDENTISCDFAETVEVKAEYVARSDLMNLGYLAETLYSTKEEEVTYEVQPGDTWSQIAERHGLSSDELLALNPGYNIDKLAVGEVLTLSASVPYLTMTVVQRERYLEDVPFDIAYTDTADLYKGDYKVTSPGAYGTADIMANATYVNGTETERTILSTVVLRQPVTEQRLQGTTERPSWYPTGTFRWPASGRLTSTFGGRSSPGGIGSTNHKGIDIAASRGTPIYAADGGTVIYAGWMGGYGYLVQIDHGNGFVTYYAHNSSLLVSVGEHVYKGQQIARMGATGAATGSHCHFEVHVNGVARNPLNYLP